MVSASCRRCCRCVERIVHFMQLRESRALSICETRCKTTVTVVEDTCTLIADPVEAEFVVVRERFAIARAQLEPSAVGLVRAPRHARSCIRCRVVRLGVLVIGALVDFSAQAVRLGQSTEVLAIGSVVSGKNFHVTKCHGVVREFGSRDAQGDKEEKHHRDNDAGPSVGRMKNHTVCRWW